jgi:tetratricopeptide (TPR) repeat protein
MKIKMNKLLNDSLDLEAIVATAEILLEENMIKEAIEKAQEGLCLVNPLHSSSVKLYCVLIRAFYSRNTDKASQTQGYNYFFKACQAIDFHLGKAHPLHSDVYKINAQINMSIYQNYPQADFLYESCETCLRKAYGVNHPKTADAYIDIGKLYIKMGRLEEALKFAEKSAKCYEKENMRAQLGAAHIVLAQIYQSLNMYDNALDYAYSASGIYDLLVAPQNYIFSLYLIISIASKAKKDDIVINEGNKLFGYIKLKYQAPSEMSAPLLSIQFKSAIVLFITVARSLEETLKKSIVAMITDIYSTLDDNNSISIVDLDNIQIIPAENTISDLCKIIIHNDIDACKTIAEVLISSQKVHFGLYGQPKKQLSGNANATKYEVLIKILKAVKPQELIEAISN